MKPIEVKIPANLDDIWRLLRTQNNIRVVSGTGQTATVTGINWPSAHPLGLKLDNTTIESYFPFERWFRIATRLPNEVPRGIPPLPKPSLAYIGLGPMCDSMRVSGCKDALYYFKCTEWKKGGLGAAEYHYAVDCNTEYARKHFPELVEAMRLNRFWKPGDTVEVTTDWYKFKTGDKCVVAACIPNSEFVQVRKADDPANSHEEIHQDKLRRWTPGYGYDLGGHKLQPPKGYEIIPFDEVEDHPADDTLFHKDGKWTKHHAKQAWYVAPEELPFNAIARPIKPKIEMIVGEWYLMSNGNIERCDYVDTDDTYLFGCHWFVFYKGEIMHTAGDGRHVVKRVKINFTNLDGTVLTEQVKLRHEFL